MIIYSLKYKRETWRNFKIVQVYCVDSFSVKEFEHESLESPIKRTTTRRNLSPLTILNAYIDRGTKVKKRESRYSVKRLHLTWRIYIVVRDGVEVICGHAYRTD